MTPSAKATVIEVEDGASELEKTIRVRLRTDECRTNGVAALFHVYLASDAEGETIVTSGVTLDGSSVGDGQPFARISNGAWEREFTLSTQGVAPAIGFDGFFVVALPDGVVLSEHITIPLDEEA